MNKKIKKTSSPKKPKANKKLGELTPININKDEILYFIKNTELPVIISKNGAVYFDIPQKDQELLNINDPIAVTQYKDKLIRCVEYLKLEGFLPIEIQNDVSLN